MKPREWIQSFSGKVVTPLDLKPEQVDIESIAHALSQKCRFTGHCREFYSVAEHCILGASAIEQPYKLAFLLHEVSEAYLPDIAGPIKPFVWVEDEDRMYTWRRLEEQHLTAVARGLELFGLPAAVESTEVKEMDMRMLATEARDLMGPRPADWSLSVEPLEWRIESTMAPTEARERFLLFYKHLRGK